MKKMTLALLAFLMPLALLAGCATDADVTSDNLSKAAEQFEINRRIVFYNGITDVYMLTIEGFCSVENDGAKVDVTCKTGDDEYKRHSLGLSDNVTYIIEQVDGANVSPDQYRVIFKPEVLIPDVDRP